MTLSSQLSDLIKQLRWQGQITEMTTSNNRDDRIKRVFWWEFLSKIALKRVFYAICNLPRFAICLSIRQLAKNRLKSRKSGQGTTCFWESQSQSRLFVSLFNKSLFVRWLVFQYLCVRTEQQTYTLQGEALSLWLRVSVWDIKKINFLIRFLCIVFRLQ